MAERDRLVESLAHLDVQIAGARSDLQRLARSDEQELCESRLIILQVPAPALQGCCGKGSPTLHVLRLVPARRLRDGQLCNVWHAVIGSSPASANPS